MSPKTSSLWPCVYIDVIHYRTVMSAISKPNMGLLSIPLWFIVGFRSLGPRFESSLSGGTGHGEFFNAVDPFATRLEGLKGPHSRRSPWCCKKDPFCTIGRMPQSSALFLLTKFCNQCQPFSSTRDKQSRWRAR